MIHTCRITGPAEGQGAKGHDTVKTTVGSHCQSISITININGTHAESPALQKDRALQALAVVERVKRALGDQVRV